MTSKEFVRNAQTRIITGYEGEPVDKDAWLRAGRSILKNLAKELGLPVDSYKVSINKGGSAVSGDIILHGEWLHVNLSQMSFGRDSGFYWRLCNGMKDYVGKANQWEKWDSLLGLSALANKMKRSKQ